MIARIEEKTMLITICDDKNSLGAKAAETGARYIREAIEERGECNCAFVTGKSQIATLRSLAMESGIDWMKVNVFLLDEFLGLEKGHRASSSTFLYEYFLNLINGVGSFHAISSDPDKVDQTLKELNKTMKSHPLDVAFICIGENGHLAFNDPPADFDTKDAYIKVELEDRSRRQQANEGWFRNIQEVPKDAITMSIYEILGSKHIIISCPDQRKAKAVAMCIFDDITPLSPAASVRRSLDTHLFLDRLSACLVFSDQRKY